MPEIIFPGQDDLTLHKPVYLNMLQALEKFILQSLIKCTGF